MSSRRDHTVSFALPAGEETARITTMHVAVKSLLLVAVRRTCPGARHCGACGGRNAVLEGGHQRLVRRPHRQDVPGRLLHAGAQASPARRRHLLERARRHPARPARRAPEGQQQRAADIGAEPEHRERRLAERAHPKRKAVEGARFEGDRVRRPLRRIISAAAAAHPRGRGLPAPGRGRRELRQPAPARAPAAAASVAGADWFRPVVALASGPRNLPLES